VSTGEPRDLRAELRKATARTAQCIPIERLGEALTTDEQSHLERCARCQAELSLWREFDASESEADEGAAVQWISARLRNGPTAATRPAVTWWTALAGARGLAVAAVLLIAAGGIAYLIRDRAPHVRDTGTEQVYRSGRIEPLSPVGDLASPPAELQWKPVPGAVRYDLSLLEIDRRAVWRGSSKETRIALPPNVVAQFTPGKPFFWEAIARSTTDAALATTGTVRFRVVVAQPRGD
jgi:hypothetical protein